MQTKQGQTYRQVRAAALTKRMAANTSTRTGRSKHKQEGAAPSFSTPMLIVTASLDCCWRVVIFALSYQCLSDVWSCAGMFSVDGAFLRPSYRRFDTCPAWPACSYLSPSSVGESRMKQLSDSWLPDACTRSQARLRLLPVLSTEKIQTLLQNPDLFEKMPLGAMRFSLNATTEKLFSSCRSTQKKL